MIRFTGFIILMGVVFGCSKNNTLLEQSLASANENRKELEKVLAHYSRSKNDSLKLKAAIFLIENMPFHFSPKGSKVDTLNNIFEQFDLLKCAQTEVTETDRVDLAKAAFDRVAKLNLKDQLVMDTKLISAPYLIENIDVAFKAWQSAPWFSQVSFDDFCEYVLPYRVRQEQPEYWRNYLYQKYIKEGSQMTGIADVDALFAHYANKYNLINASDLLNYYRYDLNFSQLDVTLAGECLDRCAYQVYFTRAAGIPATFDHVPSWANRPFSFHAMVGNALRKQQVPNLITNQNGPIDETNTVSNAMPKMLAHQFTKEELPHGLYVQYVKTVPKVYRQTWSAQADILEVYRTVPEEQIYTKFMRFNMRDVSAEYIETGDIELSIDAKYNDFKLVYLAVFDPKGWTPVAFSKPNADGKIRFEKMGKAIVYMPVVCKDNRLYAIADPFIFNSDNSITKLNANGGNTVDMGCVRKFPFFSYTAVHSLYLNGIIFEGANREDFSDSEVLHKVDYYPFYMTQAKVNRRKSFRYLRCKPNVGGKLHLAEMAFYGRRGADTVLLTGRLFSTYSDSAMMQQGMDGDILTYYRSYTADESLCFDLGEGGDAAITRIDFAPRNDANCVIPGNHYELYYWQNGWQTLGEKQANSYHVTFKNVPQNGLYWLRCKEGGKEERIFTYENGVQRWW